jgi:hypothetical protein
MFSFDKIIITGDNIIIIGDNIIIITGENIIIIGDNIIIITGDNIIITGDNIIIVIGDNIIINTGETSLKHRSGGGNLPLMFPFTMVQQPQWAKAFSLPRINDHPQTHYTR